MSFRANINTNVPAGPQRFDPNVQQATGDDVADALNIAGFGLQIYQQHQQAEAQQKLKATQATIDQSVLAATNRIEDIINQTGTISDFQLNNIARKFQPQDVGATGALQYKEAMAEYFKNPIVAKELSQLDTTRASLRKADEQTDGLVSTILATSSEFMGVNFDNANMEQLNALEIAVRSAQNKIENANNAKEALIHKPTVDNFEKWNAAYEEARMGQQIEMLVDQLNRAEKEGTVEDLATMQESKVVLQRMIDFYSQGYNDIEIEAANNQNVTKDQLARIKQAASLKREEFTQIRNKLGEMSEEAFEKTAKILQLQKDKDQANVYDQWKDLITLSGVLPTEFQGSVFDLVLASGETKQLLATTAKAAVNKGLMNITGQADIDLGSIAKVAKTRDLKALNTMLYGKALESFDADEIQEQAQARYEWISDLINTSDANMISSMRQGGVLDKFGLSLISVLKQAEETNDNQSKINAMQLLSKTGKIDIFMEELNKANPEEAKVVSRYMASFGATDTENFLAQNPGVFFDAKQNKFVSTANPVRSDVSTPSTMVLSGIYGTMEVLSDLVTDDRNMAFQTQARMLKKYHPGLSEGQDAEHYLLSFVPPERIKGDVKKFNNEEQAAINQGLTIEEMKESTNFTTQVQQQRENLQNAYNTLIEGGQPPAQQPQVDISDMDEEEFEEYIAQLRKARGK